MAHRILLVEDEFSLRLALTDRLRAAGHHVDSEENGPAALRAASNGGYDLIILDLILPGMDGLEVCQELRKRRIHTPVLMVTARTMLEDKLRGFQCGADDYLTKPFDVPELEARVRALLRRGPPSPQSALRIGRVFKFGDVVVDSERSLVTVAGEVVPLSTKEYDLLLYLLKNAGKPVKRADLLRNVWHSDTSTPTRTVDVHVGWLRKKIRDDPKNPRWIRTVYGVGYQFVAN